MNTFGEQARTASKRRAPKLLYPDSNAGLLDPAHNTVGHGASTELSLWDLTSPIGTS